MSVLFLTEQGARLTKEGRAFVLKKDGEKVFVYPSANVKQVFLFGRIEVTAAMIHLLLREGIDTTFLTRDGRYRGRLVGKTSKNIELREAQFERSHDEEFCLNFSRKIVWAKAKNALRILQKSRGVAKEEFAQRVQNFRKSVRKIKTMDQLRGLEGAFSALYFRLFPELLIERFGFKKREKHPPPDPVNILLSLGYTLLFQNIYALVTGMGFDPYRGFYHQIRYGHPALVSDLMEEFRAAVVDSLIVKLVNRKQITWEHFERDGERYQFKKEGLEVFINAYREKLETAFQYRKMKITYMQALQYQVVQFQKHILGEVEYVPFIYP